MAKSRRKNGRGRRAGTRPVKARRSCGIERACGGCALLAHPFREQMRTKTDIVCEALAEHAETRQVPVEACVPAPTGYAYRVRAKLAVRRAGGRVRIGLYRRGSDRLVDLGPCLVHRPVVQDALAPLARWLEEERLAFPEGPVIVVDLRESHREALHLTLVVDEATARPEAWPLTTLRRAVPQLEGVALNVGNVRSSYALGPSFIPLEGAGGPKLEVETPSGGVLAEIPPGAFFQVNPAALPAVHDRLAGHLDAAGTLFDLYCGVGTHALGVAERIGARRVVGVEEHGGAAEAARRNVKRAGLDARILAGRVEERIAELGEAGDDAALVMNPGRPGCRRAVLDAILAMRPRRAAYLSCNPVTLARDLALLARGGFETVRVVPFDFMPQTDQVEALALLA